MLILISLNPRLVGQVFRHEKPVHIVDLGLNPRLVGQVFRRKGLDVHDAWSGSLNPRLVGQVFRLTSINNPQVVFVS